MPLTSSLKSHERVISVCGSSRLVAVDLHRTNTHHAKAAVSATGMPHPGNQPMPGMDVGPNSLKKIDESHIKPSTGMISGFRMRCIAIFAMDGCFTVARWVAVQLAQKGMDADEMRTLAARRTTH